MFIRCTTWYHTVSSLRRTQSCGRSVPEIGCAQEILGDAAQGQQTKKKLETRVQDFKGTKSWVMYMHTQMKSALEQSKKERTYPKCTGGSKLYVNKNRVCLMERVPLCQYAWEDDTFKRASKKNTPTWA